MLLDEAGQSLAFKAWVSSFGVRVAVTTAGATESIGPQAGVVRNYFFSARVAGGLDSALLMGRQAGCTSPSIPSEINNVYQLRTYKTG